jgi:hypothetical protein
VKPTKLWSSFRSSVWPPGRARAALGAGADEAPLRSALYTVDQMVAKERCDDVAGNVKDVCVKQAEATHTSALADAKMGQQISAARTDAAEEKRDADYKVELEKCDASTGEAKSQCVAAAKTKFGKS